MNRSEEIEDLVRYDAGNSPETPIEIALGVLNAHQSWLAGHRAEVPVRSMRPQGSIYPGY